jgi:uncharacterized protein
MSGPVIVDPCDLALRLSRRADVMASVTSFETEGPMVAKNVVHFDVHADDVERAKGFYGRVFGWRFSQWGPPDFFMIATGNDADPGIHGAVHERPRNEARSVGFQCTIAVDDVDAIAKLVVSEGGKITVPKMTIPTVGELIQFTDTEGNVVSAMRYFTDGK